MSMHSLLSPVRHPTELADESSAISNVEASSALSKFGVRSSPRPLREPLESVVVTDEEVLISSGCDQLQKSEMIHFCKYCKKPLFFLRFFKIYKNRCFQINIIKYNKKLRF